jgi:hypothetical protein
MTTKDLANLIRKLSDCERNIFTALSKTEASFLLELIQKNWKKP